MGGALEFLILNRLFLFLLQPDAFLFRLPLLALSLLFGGLFLTDPLLLRLL